MSLLDKASLILTPNAYNVNKLYSIIPSNGDGDMTFARGTNATRINSSGVIETVGATIPRLNYDTIGGCPSILLEPQRTNLLLNSVWAGGTVVSDKALPTSWVQSTNTGTHQSPITSIKNNNVTAYRFVTSNSRQEILQNISLLLNSITTFSCYVESVTTAIAVNQLLRFSAVTGTGTYIFLKNNTPILGSENITAGDKYSLQFTCTLADSFQVRIGVGVGGNTTGDIIISMPQLESGSYVTSYIPTTTSTVTRNADLITRNNIYTNGFITSAGGTWFIELNNNFSLTRDDGTLEALSLQTSSTSTNNALCLRAFPGGGRLNILKRIETLETFLYTTLTDTIKVAFKWNGATADVYVNGTKIISATAFTTTNMDYLISRGLDVPKYIKSTMLFPTPLTDTECISLTTL